MVPGTHVPCSDILNKVGKHISDCGTKDGKDNYYNKNNKRNNERIFDQPLALSAE
jgi:hypothetical protein